MLIHEIAKIVTGQLLHQTTNDEIRSLNFDSRKSAGNKNELFIAIKSAKNDGHRFLDQLYTLGVRNFLISDASHADKLVDCNVILVENTLIALQRIATYHRKQFSIPVIGIAGSNGKTIIKEWLSTILAQKWEVIKSPKSYNSQIGVPLSVWQIDPHHEIGVFEAGISRNGEMEALANIIQPTLGIFTNLGAAHDEGFKSPEEKATEKARLFTSCEQIICRHGHSLVRETLEQEKGQIISWDMDTSAAPINFRSSGENYSVSYNGKDYLFKIHLKHPQDLENIFHAVSAAILLGESESLIQQAISKIRSIPMRLELKRGINDTYILDDSYNNDLLGLGITLDYLHQQPKKESKTVILSDILQSGKSRNTLYGEVSDLLKKHKISRLIGIGAEISQAAGHFTLSQTFYPSTDAFLKNAPDFHNEIILIKGARDFNFEKVVSYLEDKSHRTVLEINYEAITHNLNVYRNILKPSTKLMVMVKAFAYGLGVNEIAHLLQYHKVDYLGVAYLDEAIELRKKGISLPIMIMNPERSGFPLLETFDLEPEIFSLSMLQQLLEDCKNPPGIHLKIETGMHRLGFEEEDIESLLALLKTNPQVKVTGIFTHFSSSDVEKEDWYTRRQSEKFENIYDRITASIGYRPVRHALNSSGIARWPQYQFEMVRLGIGLYGFDSSGAIHTLRPISTLKTQVSQVKKVEKGDTIGYSRKGVVEKDGEIATLAIGYADGYMRVFSNGNAYVMINGQKAKTIGNVCMDMTMVDVTGISVKSGDEVIIFGEDPSIVDLAKWAGTIPYEILTNISQRVKRVFVSE